MDSLSRPNSAAQVRLCSAAKSMTRQVNERWNIDDSIGARAKIEMEYPMKRIAAPREIVQAALSLASPVFPFMTGQSIVVDGGLTVNYY